MPSEITSRSNLYWMQPVPNTWEGLCGWWKGISTVRVLGGASRCMVKPIALGGSQNRPRRGEEEEEEEEEVEVRGSQNRPRRGAMTGWII